jgi:hypothetical protein
MGYTLKLKGACVPADGRAPRGKVGMTLFIGTADLAAIRAFAADRPRLGAAAA